MEYKCCALLTTALILVMLVNCSALRCAGSSYSRGCCGKEAIAVGERQCALCNTIPTRTCCVEGAITDYFQMDQFEKMFSNRDSLEVESHANKAFWDYQSFITASAYFQPYGFGTTYINRKFTGTKEVAAFLAHVATKTSCEFKVSLLWNFNLEFYVVGLVEYICLTTSFLYGFDFIGSKWIWGYKFGFK